MKKIIDFHLDKKKKEEVEQELNRLLGLCQQYNIPMFASVLTDNDASNTSYMNVIYGAKAHQFQLADDQINQHMLICNGFRAVPPRDVMEMDMFESDAPLPVYKEDKADG